MSKPVIVKRRRRASFKNTEAAEGVEPLKSDRVYRNLTEPLPEEDRRPGGKTRLAHNPFADLLEKD